MVYAAARGLASTVADEDYQAGRLFPRLQLIQDVSAAVAHAVAKQAAREGLNGITWSSDEELMELIRDRMWDPQHAQMIRVESL
jgi:malate dehydrogenase (oxaloacetate-decarboxylating)(NADP+)